jgi:hypothetical protein
MDRPDLDHLLRAAGDATGQKTFVLVGSAAIFAWRQVVPMQMMMSREADLFAFDVSDEVAERIADELDGDLGQQSQFDDTHGYYVDGVEPKTVVLPEDWRDRSKPYSSSATGGVVAIVPHPDDIALSKLCAGREKDLDWVAAARREGIVSLRNMAARIDKLPGRTDDQREHIRKLIEIVEHRRITWPRPSST